tara:strand:- start:117 stop:386 length:270 start_codon:yes stop_codon:yes gene_type:complete
MTNEMTTSEGDYLANKILQDVNSLYEDVEQLARDGEEHFMVSNKMQQLAVLETMMTKLNTTDHWAKKVTCMIAQIRYTANFNWPEKFSI